MGSFEETPNEKVVNMSKLNKSYFSFLIPPEVYPGRIGLLLTTLLVLVNIFLDVMESTPMSGSINQVQFWLLSCIGFVSLAVFIYSMIMCTIQFSFLNGIYKNNPKRHIFDNFGLIFVPITFIIHAIIYTVSL